MGQLAPGSDAVGKFILGVAKKQLPATTRLDSTDAKMPIGKGVTRQLGLYAVQAHVFGEQAVGRIEHLGNAACQFRRLAGQRGL
mgnify:CR=1 FL=1